MSFKWRAHMHAGVAVVICQGELDEMPSGFREGLMTAAAGAGQRLVVDLNGVSFMQSIALGQLFGVAATLRQRGGALALVCPPGNVARVLKLSGLSVQSTHLRVYDSVDAASDALKGGLAGA
jgi:anti-sigma B factor antagonist